MASGRSFRWSCWIIWNKLPFLHSCWKSISAGHSMLCTTLRKGTKRSLYVLLERLRGVGAVESSALFNKCCQTKGIMVLCLPQKCGRSYQWRVWSQVARRNSRTSYSALLNISLIGSNSRSHGTPLHTIHCAWTLSESAL